MTTQNTLVLAFMGFFTLMTSTAQVGIGTTNPDANALLDLNSNTQGFLPPRLTEDQRKDIVPPITAGLIIWCTNCGDNGELQVYNGFIWTNMVGDPGSFSQPPAIGDLIQGGIVAYIFGPSDSGYVDGETHGILTSVTNLGSDKKWGCNTNNPTNLDQSIGEAISNTTQIITANAGCSNYAAKICRNHNGGGFSDWSLPTINELQILFNNRLAIGGFNTNEYWASFMTSDPFFSGATTFNFETGTAGVRSFSQSFLGTTIRAIRYF